MPVGAQTAAVHVEGLKDVQRALNKINKDASKRVRKELRTVAKPVKATAEALAVQEITNIGPAWSRMRIGAPAGSVYVAPRQRGQKQGPAKRANLAIMLADEVFSPTLAQHEDQIMRDVEEALDRLGHEAGF